MIRRNFAFLGLFLSSLILPSIANAQLFTDVLRYSQQTYQSTARSISCGGAFGAVGGDFVSASINPAGLGVYRKSEFAGSFGFSHPSATSTFLGQESQDDKYNFNVGGVGLVLSDVKYSQGIPKTTGWVNVTYAFGFNRTQSYQAHTTLEAINTKTSITDFYKDKAYGQPEGALSSLEDPFSIATLAYNSLLINKSTTDSYSYVGAASGEKKPFRKLQNDQIYTRGAMNDINLSVGGNYENRFYIGGSILIPIVNYTSERTFSENNLSRDDSVVIYKSSKLTENVSTSGYGFAAILGVIYRPKDWLRLGLSFHSPTYLSMSDDYTTEISTVLKYPTTSPATYGQVSPAGTYQYSIVTPFRYTLSGALLDRRYGFISLDYEYVDYTQGRINTNFEGAQTQNKNTKYYLQGTGNLRLGAEYINGIFALRGGLGFLGSPYKSQFASSGGGGGNTYSLGIGLKDIDKSNNQVYYLDIGYQVISTNYTYIPYSLTNPPANYSSEAKVRDYKNNLVVTLGIRF